MIEYVYSEKQNKHNWVKNSTVLVWTKYVCIIHATLTQNIFISSMELFFYLSGYFGITKLVHSYGNQNNLLKIVWTLIIYFISFLLLTMEKLITSIFKLMKLNSEFIILNFIMIQWNATWLFGKDLCGTSGGRTNFPYCKGENLAWKAYLWSWPILPASWEEEQLHLTA